MSLGRPGDARDAYTNALAIRDDLVKRSGSVRMFALGLASSLRRLALAKRALGENSRATADLLRAARLLDGDPALPPEGWYELACAGNLVELRRRAGFERGGGQARRFGNSCGGRLAPSRRDGLP